MINGCDKQNFLSKMQSDFSSQKKISVINTGILEQFKLNDSCLDGKDHT